MRAMSITVAALSRGAPLVGELNGFMFLVCTNSVSTQTLLGREVECMQLGGIGGEGHSFPWPQASVRRQARHDRMPTRNARADDGFRTQALHVFHASLDQVVGAVRRTGETQVLRAHPHCEFAPGLRLDEVAHVAFGRERAPLRPHPTRLAATGAE